MLQEYIDRLRRTPWAADTQDAHTLAAFVATLPDPATAPSPWWMGPERDRTDLERALSIHQGRDEVMRIGRIADMEAGIRTVARLAFDQPEGPLKEALTRVRWDLEEALEMAQAQGGPRPALWPPKPGDTWKALETGRLWKGAWTRTLRLGLVATSWRPLNAHKADCFDPEEAWETFGPFQYVSGPAVDEHPYTQVVRELLEEVPGFGGQGGVYEAALLQLQAARADDADAHHRLMQVMGHWGGDEDICQACAEEELTEDELEDPWSVKPLVGECLTLTTPN